MEERIGGVRRILNSWRGRQAQISAPAQELERSTSPCAPMSLILRFETEAGPRTVIASGIPLAHASDIAWEMEKAGHYAQFVDQLPNLSIGERVKLHKSGKQASTRRKQSALSVVRDLGMAG
jgi:hypothetical protein